MVISAGILTGIFVILVFSILSFMLSLYAVIKILAAEKSTHRIEYINPFDSEGDQEESQGDSLSVLQKALTSVDTMRTSAHYDSSLETEDMNV